MKLSTILAICVSFPLTETMFPFTDQSLHSLNTQSHKGALLFIFVESVVPVGHSK